MKSKAMMLIPLSLLLVGQLTAQAIINVNAKVDYILTRSCDITGDGQEDQIILRIQGQDFMHPFTWRLEIRSGETSIFRHQSNDTWLDENFNDKGYVFADCDGYVECKQKYYFEMLLDGLISTEKLSQENRVFDRTSARSIHVVAREYLSNVCRVPEDKTAEIVQKMIERLKSGKAVVLNVPISPVQNQFPRMYVEEVGQFVPIYEW